jgi:hypothetical protein
VDLTLSENCLAVLEAYCLATIRPSLAGEARARRYSDL